MAAGDRLIVVCGLPGTGKTTVAADLAERLGGALLRTDVVRKELFPDPEYTSAETTATYDELFSRSIDAVERDRVAILDGTFRRSALRDRAREVAREADASFDLVRVTCPEPIVRKRIAERNGDASDADFGVHQLLRQEFEAPTIDHYEIENGGSLAQTRRQLEVVV